MSTATVRATGLKDRIRMVRKAEWRRSAEAFAALIGVKGGAVRNWEAGVQPSEDNLKAIAQIGGVTLEWLKTGVGTPPRELLLPQEQRQPARKTRATPELAHPPSLAATEPANALDVLATEDDGDGRMVIRRDSVIERIRRPDVLVGRPEAYALFVSTEAMSPAFRYGDTIWADPMLPVAKESEVVITRESGDEQIAMLGTLVDYTRDEWIVDMLKPPRRLKLKRDEWPSCHRIVGKTMRR